MESHVLDGARITGLVASFLESDANRLAIDDEPAWDQPLVGFAAGDDPVFAEIKAQIGEFYWTPIEAYGAAFPDDEAHASDLTVVAWILPHTEATRKDCAAETQYPPRRWVHAKRYGEEVNRKLRSHLAKTLIEAGHRAVAPIFLFDWEYRDSWGFASRWSERHAAYAAGLGTFGLCDGLITPVGKAMRCGSIVARIAVEPTPRPYSGIRDYCLYYANGSCGDCIDRCPAGAITRRGHNKRLCNEHLYHVSQPWVEETFGFSTDACGLCQTGVPCENQIPAELR